MSSSVLLRVLLCLLLVLNGTGSAVAAARMALEHVAPGCQSAQAATGTGLAGTVDRSIAAPRSAAAATMPCHDAAQAAARAGHPQPPLGDPGEACCDSGQCACLQQVIADTPAAALPAPMPDTRGADRHPAGGHIPPVLAHLIRPPIG